MSGKMSLFSSLFCFLSRVSCGSVNTHSQFSYQLCQHNVCRGCEDRLNAPFVWIVFHPSSVSMNNTACACSLHATALNSRECGLKSRQARRLRISRASAVRKTASVGSYCRSVTGRRHEYPSRGPGRRFRSVCQLKAFARSELMSALSTHRSCLSKYCTPMTFARPLDELLPVKWSVSY